jgi:hypothetical protein
LLCTNSKSNDYEKIYFYAVVNCPEQYCFGTGNRNYKEHYHFFEGMHSRDTIKIKSVCNAPLLLQSVSSKNGKTVLQNESGADFYKSIAAIPADMKIEERLLDYKIQYDGAMAHVWTPYEFYINGKLSHKGVNFFQLYNDNGIWKITYIIDTRRK